MDTRTILLDTKYAFVILRGKPWISNGYSTSVGTGDGQRHELDSNTVRVNVGSSYLTCLVSYI